MKVSFVVPIYNIEKYVSECIESIVKQQGESFEVILVDDGSSDKSGEICIEYAKKYSNIKVLQQKNQGVSSARNYGLRESKGDWVIFIDGDDTISNDFLQLCAPFLNDQFDVCFIEHKEINSGKSKTQNKNELNLKSIIFNKEDFEEFELATFNRDYKGKYDYHKVKMATPCKFYRKALLDKYNIKFPAGVAIGEDALFNLEVYRYAEKGVYINKEIYYHRIWPNSVSQKYDSEIDKKFAILHKSLRRYIESSKNPQKYEKVYNERCIWSVGFCCILNYCNKNNTDSYKERKRQFQNLRQTYYTEIKNTRLNNFRLEKKILFLCIKKNWFAIINILTILNSKKK